MTDALAEYAVKEAFLKKSKGTLRKKQRGALTSEADEQRILKFIDDNRISVHIDIVVLSCGTFIVNRSYTLTVSYMADCLGISKNTYTNWKKGFQDKRKGAKHVNNMKYTEEERQQAYCALMLNSDVSPSELVAKYLDEKGIYLGSAKWLYRLLEEVKSNAKRGSSSNSNKDDSVERRTLTATRPNQVWIWDVTYLYKTNPLGEYFYLYAVMDLFSRNKMHWEVHNTQSADIAARFIEKAVKKIGFIKPKNEILNTDGINSDTFGNVLELYSDNGAPKRGSTMVSKCLELGISCT